eukprot:2650003-Amphidinium_carterae.1
MSPTWFEASPGSKLSLSGAPDGLGLRAAVGLSTPSGEGGESGSGGRVCGGGRTAVWRSELPD